MEDSTSPIIEFLKNNTAALFALLGVILGSLLSYITNRSLSMRDLKLRLREKVLDKRIQAHEQVIELAKSLRTMINLGQVNSEGDLARSPYFLASQEAFREHQAAFSYLFGHSSTWLSIELTRELNLIQDYLVNLDLVIRQAPPEVIQLIGNLIRNDLVTFSGEIERMAYSFFEKDLEKLKVSSLSEWHKYTREESERRLNQSALYQRREEIQALLDGRP